MQNTPSIPFNRASISALEIEYVKQCLESRSVCGDGAFTHWCEQWLENQLQAEKVLLTPSCTAALEMSALLLNLKPGDEVIMPSFTFVSTANAFLLRGATPVFVDIRPDTLNLDEDAVEAAITSRTKAIVPVFYAGVPSDMTRLRELADHKKIPLVVDAAQSLGSLYKGRPATELADLSCFSFHETKNVTGGEAGALAISSGSTHFTERA